VVGHLDFFPFLRFYQLLTKTLYPRKHDSSKPHKGGPDSKKIDSSKLYILFDLGEDQRDGVLHATKFSQVKRLIELHWVDGLPIWGCLTGLGDCYGDCEGPFADWMYSVRQIVALYRVDRETWKSHSLKYLHMYKWMDHNEASADSSTTLSNPELIEAVIDMLCKAIEFNLGYEGNFSLINRKGEEWKNKGVFKMFQYKGKYRKVALEKQHAIVHIVGQYRAMVDAELRERLGEACEEWEGSDIVAVDRRLQPNGHIGNSETWVTRIHR
jgi:hypothetical protein